MSHCLQGGPPCDRHQGQVYVMYSQQIRRLWIRGHFCGEQWCLVTSLCEAIFLRFPGNRAEKLTESQVLTQMEKGLS